MRSLGTYLRNRGIETRHLVSYNAGISFKLAVKTPGDSWSLIDTACDIVASRISLIEIPRLPRAARLLNIPALCRVADNIHFI